MRIAFLDGRFCRNYGMILVYIWHWFFFCHTMVVFQKCALFMPFMVWFLVYISQDNLSMLIFLKVRKAFVFGLRAHSLIDFNKIYECIPKKKIFFWSFSTKRNTVISSKTLAKTSVVTSEKTGFMFKVFALYFKICSGYLDRHSLEERIN